MPTELKKGKTTVGEARDLISEFEELGVTFKNENERVTRSDKVIDQPKLLKRKTNNNATVAALEKRYAEVVPGSKPEAVKKNGQEIHGNKKVGNARKERKNK